MNSHKIIYAALFTLGVIILVSLLWKHSILLSVSLVILAILKNRIAPVKNELVWFVIIAVWGTVSEVLIMEFGNKPWVYADPIIFNIAIWTPLLWGIAATIFITLHEGIFKST